MKSLAAFLLLGCLAGPAPAFAREPINQERHIINTLVQGFIADAIADNCPTISGRRLRALNELRRLRDYALSKGYTAEEVRGLVESKAEKARGRAMAADWLKKNGAVSGQPESYCAIGREQIAKNTFVGYLLRSK